MTVRITKPEFNLREKLTHLDVPLGSHGSQLMRSESGSESFSLVRAGRKNMIINGGMNINQRNGTSSYTIPHGTSGSYGGPDRWAVVESTDGSVSVNMDGDPPNYPQVSEWSRAFQIACSGTGALSSGHNTHFFQNIEGYNIINLGWGTLSAKPVTLSFWVKTNKGGVYSVGLENSAADRNCIRNYYHDGSHTWKKYVLTFPRCTDGTWLTTNGIGMRVRFCLASGSQYDDGVDGEWVNSDELHTGNQTNFMSSTNNRFMITGVQLEEGTVATPFEHRNYAEELSLCKRYYQQVGPASSGVMILAGAGNGTSRIRGMHQLIPEMRATPTTTADTSSENFVFYAYSGGGVTYSSVNSFSGTSKNIHWDFNTSTHNREGLDFDVKGSGARVQIDAEL